MSDAERDREIVRRYSDGKNGVREIARAVGVSVRAVYGAIERAGITKRADGRALAAARLVDTCKRGGRVKDTAARLGISESTAGRILKERRGQGVTINSRKGRPPAFEKSVPIVAPVIRVAVVAVDDAEIDRAVADLLRAPFPFPMHLTGGETLDEIEKLRAVRMTLDAGHVIRPLSLYGLRLCKPFFPHRYKATSRGVISAFDSWRSEVALRRAVRFQLEHGDPVAPHRVLRAITLRSRTPTIFRPGIARFIYQRYCPAGGLVWDPCSGYGGRLLGAFAAGVRYIGTDVDAATVEGNRSLARAVGFDADVRLCGAEDFAPPSVDLVFTSPPYFDRERYSDHEQQSWKRHGGSLDAWIAGFLRPVIQRAWDALPVSGCLVLNVADLKERSVELPIVRRTIETAREIGFDHTETLRMPLAAINRKAPTEPVLVFGKRR